MDVLFLSTIIPIDLDLDENHLIGIESLTLYLLSR